MAKYGDIDGLIKAVKQQKKQYKHHWENRSDSEYWLGWNEGALYILDWFYMLLTNMTGEEQWVPPYKCPVCHVDLVSVVDVCPRCGNEIQNDKNSSH